jgi:hypothetical protein
MSTAERYEPFLRDTHRLSRKQQRWPSLGWLLGETRWYLLGAVGGATAAIFAFTVWLILVA